MGVNHAKDGRDGRDGKEEEGEDRKTNERIGDSFKLNANEERFSEIVSGELSSTKTMSESSGNCENSQISSSAHLRKVKRTFWYGRSQANRYGLNYAVLFVLILGRVEGITTTGEKALATGSHSLSERSAAIVKLERDYQPIIFGNKESVEDNHLHLQRDDKPDLIRADAFTVDDEHILSNPTSLPESSRSTIIFRGVRNRTRVEVGPVNLFTTKRKAFDSEEGNRRGRVMFAKSEPLNERENLTSSEEGSSRKASPDVQDIIDGIVKLLGGKVHHGQNQPQSAAAPIPFAQRQPQSTAYNLFNPNKPIYYQTAKPSRINSRGPPLSAGNGNGNGAAGAQVEHSSQQQSSFEAIPLEALNSEFKLNETRFGPPFPLSQVPQPEAPYKQGVPLPEQLVPTTSAENFNLRQNQQQPQNENIFYGNRYSENGGHSPTPTGLTTPNKHITRYHHNNHQYDNFNENGTRNPYQQNDSGEDRRRPTISDGEGSPLTTQASNGFDKNLIENNRALPTPRPPPISLTLPTAPEDDEEDDLRFTTVDFDRGQTNKWNNPRPTEPKKETSPPLILEPTTEDSQVPWSVSDSGRVGSSKETDYSGEAPQTAEIRPTSVNSLYPTLVLETNSENGLVEIVTKLAAPTISPTSTTQGGHQQTIIPFVSATNHNHQQPHPESNLRKQVQHFNSLVAKHQTNVEKQNSQSIHSLPTPPLRPGIVINDGPAGGDKGYGSVEVVTVDEKGQKIGEVFDVTVTAKQSFGGKHTGQAFSVSDPKDDLVITHPTGTEQYVSIDGKRTYFHLQPNTPTAIGAGSSTRAVGQVLPVENTELVSIEVNKHPKAPPPTTVSTKPKNIGVGTVGNPVPLLPQPPGKTLFGIGSGSSGSAPGRAVSTSLSISGSGGSSLGISGPSGGSKTLPNLIRRPHTRRPSIPPVRIDTCIVGDDTTCNSEQGEVCRTESGVSSCVCRSGYARRRHREPCKAIVSLVMSIKLDKLGDKKLTYNPDYFNPNSEIYQTLEWETIHAMDSAMGETTLSVGYVGSKLEAIGFDGRHAVVNTTVLIQDNPKQQASQVKRDLQKQMIQVLTRNRNNFGKSQLWVEGPISAVAAITDFDECESPESNDCDNKANCVNTLGSFECKCEAGYGDPFEKDKRRSGRKCESCSGKQYCNGRGECLIENGQKVCKCAGNYYGSQCDIDGEVLAVAIGASVSAVVIIGLTLACLCMWSRKWKREEQKAAMMSRTLFGGMATQALSYLGKNNSNPYQQHLSMDDRLRWAQAQDVSMGGNIYVQNEPMSMHTSPQLIGTSMMETPPLMSARRSAETVDTTVDDLYEDRQQKRPRSRASQMQGSLYYDLEPEPKSDIYASRSMVQFPAQFCVPMGPMSHYAPPNRGYYP